MDSVKLESCPEVLTVQETSRLLRLGRNATYEAIRRGEIPSLRVGRRIVIPRAALERLLSGDLRLVVRDHPSSESGEHRK